VVIPDSAILDTGTRQIVYVETTPGRFAPRAVVVGTRSAGNASILTGVAAGEKVVIKGNFLVDSESRLRAAVNEPAAGPPEPQTEGAEP
jgi:multidrug efflux pump subunit AcrA (membrane-fusion protein)